MTRPLVSVVMAAYNAERFVGAALESVLAQDYEPVEVIVVDDGSTDRTGKLVRSFPSVRYARQGNAGPSAARNAAIAMAGGELVANCDADDLLPPHRIRVQVEHLLAHPEVGCVFGRQEWIDPPPWLTRDAVYGELDGIPLTSAMFRRSVLERLGGFDTAFDRGEDMDLLIRMREQGIELAVLPELCVYRRFHGSNLTAQEPAENPMLRSLRAKLERSRTASDGSGR